MIVEVVENSATTREKEVEYMKFITPSELVNAFLAGETNMRTWTKQKPGPLRIINDKIICFETVICERFGEKYLVNARFYSKQTEIAQNLLLQRIPKEKQIHVHDVPYIYWGSLADYIEKISCGKETTDNSTP